MSRKRLAQLSFDKADSVELDAQWMHSNVLASHLHKTLTSSHSAALVSTWQQILKVYSNWLSNEFSLHSCSFPQTSRTFIYSTTSSTIENTIILCTYCHLLLVGWNHFDHFLFCHARVRVLDSTNVIASFVWRGPSEWAPLRRAEPVQLSRSAPAAHRVRHREGPRERTLNGRRPYRLPRRRRLRCIWRGASAHPRPHRRRQRWGLLASYTPPLRD